MLLGEKKGKSLFCNILQNVMWKMLEEIILFYAPSDGPQLDKCVIFKALFFKKWEGLERS